MKSNEKSKAVTIAWYVLFAAMAIYYGWRLFAFTPWYDELYTYYYFISRGPVYAAIHWPLPNNHVGYSVLSAFLDFFGNSYIGLRGVSYLSALANMILVYRLGGRYLKGWAPLNTVILYVSVGLVNQMAVQGRGYTLGITCCLLAWRSMAAVCEEEKPKKKYYLIYILSLVLGLYTVSSDVYWVIPLCLAGGGFLLIRSLGEAADFSENRKPYIFLKTGSGKKLIRLIAASLCAAFLTVILYASIWVSIGSNLLVKDAESPWYGMGHIKMILSAPFAAMSRGMEYMLATPYIQSEERAGFFGRLLAWLGTLADYYYHSLSLPVILVFAAGSVYLIFKAVRNLKKGSDRNLLLYLFLIIGILLAPVILLIQCKRPYYRVFTYGGILLAFMLGVILSDIADFFSKKMKEGRKRELISGAVCIAVLAFGVKCLASPGYNEQYGIREHEIELAFAAAEMENYENFCVTDCNQEYLLYFLYGIRCENREIEGADVVLLDKRMCRPEFDEMVWEFYHYYDTIPWDYIERNLTKVYGNNDYVLYVK